ncbi:MAG: hypothetical protein EXR79_06770 [Myxococcales bacterium]|nr:hypothetical protein [Myxococcales bacterium]
MASASTRFGSPTAPAPALPALAPQGGRPEAAAATWSWRPEVAVQAASRTRLRFALRGGVGGGGGAILWQLGWLHAGSVALVLGVSVMLAAAALPARWLRRADDALPGLGRAASHVVAWPLLFVMFWSVFVPFGLLLRRGRRDPLCRSFDATAPTYWQRPTRPSDPTRPF